MVKRAAERDLGSERLEQLVRELVNRRRGPDDELPIADTLRLAVAVEALHSAGASLDSMVAIAFRIESGIGPAAREACHGVVEAIIRSYLAVDAQSQEERERRLREQAYQHRQEALTDYLTGLANRAAFDTAMHRELARARRHSRPLSLLLLDIDDLKSINDQHLHHTGDEAIRVVAHIVARAVRASDICARLGGDEFGIAMPEAGLVQAEEAAARIRAALASFNGEHSLPLPLDLSIGIAAWDGEQTYTELFDAADRRLYAQKRRHRRAAARAGPPLAPENKAPRRSGKLPASTTPSRSRSTSTPATL